MKSIIIHREKLKYLRKEIISAIVIFFSLTWAVGAAAQCQAFFIMQPDSSSNLTIHFQNLSTGNFTQVNWNFGDGSSSNQYSPTHTFNHTGNYNVCLTISDSLGACYDVSCVQLSLNPNPACKANFQSSAMPSSTTVAFFNTSSSIGGNFLSFWNFGDSTTAFTHSPLHTYAQGGVYNVCLIIVDLSTGCADTYCAQVAVANAPQCNAFFIAALDTSVNTPNFYQFLDQSFALSPITSWSWDFGDGASSNIPNPTHQYLAPGAYNVCLSIHTQNNCTSNHCMTLHVGAPNLYHMGGQVFAGSSLVDEFDMLLYRPTGFAMHSLDTLHFDTLGFYYLFQLPEGMYYIKVKPSKNSQFYSSHAPTYLGQELIWDVCAPYNHNSIDFAADIHLKPINTPATAGIGEIGGLINGAISGSPYGPIRGMDVLLFSPIWDLIAHTNTDSIGHYKFQHLPMGDYIIYPEMTGIPTQPVQVSLGTSTAQKDSINFLVGQIITSVDESNPLTLEGFKAYPNPTHDFLTIESKANLSSQKLNYMFFDHSGRVVSLGAISSARQEIDVRIMTPGHYLLVITDMKKNPVWRVQIIKH